MKGEELYDTFRQAAQAEGATLYHLSRRPASTYEPPDSTHLPHWYELKEREKRVWESTASRLPIEKPGYTAAY